MTFPWCKNSKLPVETFSNLEYQRKQTKTKYWLDFTAHHSTHNITYTFILFTHNQNSIEHSWARSKIPAGSQLKNSFKVSKISPNLPTGFQFSQVQKSAVQEKLKNDITFYIKINILYNNKNIDQCYKVFSEMAELIVVFELTISPEIS